MSWQKVGGAFETLGWTRELVRGVGEGRSLCSASVLVAVDGRVLRTYLGCSEHGVMPMAHGAVDVVWQLWQTH